MNSVDFVDKLVGKFWGNIRLYEHKGVNLSAFAFSIKMDFKTIHKFRTIEMKEDRKKKSNNDDRFWKRLDIKDVINITLAAIGLGFAIYSVILSVKSLDVADKSLKYSHRVDSVNRIKDSINDIFEREYKKEIKNIQDIQQKLLDSLVSITRISIDKKIFNERPKLSLDIKNFSNLDFTKADTKYYFISAEHSIHNLGVRDAINATKKISFYTEGSNQYFYLSAGPFQPMQTTRGITAKNITVIEKKFEKNKFGKKYWSLYVLLEAKWYDVDLGRYDKEELMMALKYFTSGNYIIDLLDLNEREKIKKKINSLNGISLSDKYIIQKSAEFFPGNVIDTPN